MIDDPDWVARAHAAAAPLVTAARTHGPLPSARSEEFLNGPLVAAQALLIVCGIDRVAFGDPLLRSLREVSNQVHGGDRRFRRQVAASHVPLDELQRRRYPPTGDRDEWVRTGGAA